MASERIAVVVAHPDDEVLAFGGSMCRHAELGHTISVLILATGLASRSADGQLDRIALAQLRQEAQAAAKILGAQQVEFADFPDNSMDSVPLLSVIKRVEAFVDSTDPTVVYTHHHEDLNVDHAVTARAVLTACRPLPGSKVSRLYAGEVISSSEYSPASERFVPNVYVPIAPFLDRKCKALECYRTEIRAWPHPRSVQAVEALARLRGSECGVDAAEALSLLREVVRQ